METFLLIFKQCKSDLDTLDGHTFMNIFNDTYKKALRGHVEYCIDAHLSYTSYIDYVSDDYDLPY